MFEQLFCVATRAVGDLGAGEHARQLFDTTTPVESCGDHLRSILDDFLLHDEMAIGEPGDLWLVSDA